MLLVSLLLLWLAIAKKSGAAAVAADWLLGGLLQHLRKVGMARPRWRAWRRPTTTPGSWR
ncbi:hypothetical protein KCP74_22690 [Salmonella enterica subsp. enterica]|nr:hypothetical protein KCP74_22690 [Salmonella enterica subsp. enterica]